MPSLANRFSAQIGSKLFLSGDQRVIAASGLVIATLCWGGNTIAGRLSVGDIPPVALSFWRWSFCLLFLLPFSVKQIWSERHNIWQHKGSLLLLAFFSITSFNTVLYLAAQSTQAVNMALIQTSLPIMAMLLSVPLLRVFPFRNQIIGGLIAIAGLLLIFSQGSFENLSELQFGHGDLLMMFATFSWATYTVLLKRFHLPVQGVTLLVS